MELGNKEVKYPNTGMISVHTAGISLHPLPDVNAPLTGDVIRDNDFDEFSQLN
jgi:hypothetical protein